MGAIASGVTSCVRERLATTSRESIMIQFILLQNRQGRTRLAKYYVPFTDAEKHKIEHDVHRRYAGLYFSLCVDSTDNELVCLEIIHLFVEILDHYFSNVRELDLVYNFHKVFVITDELVLSGELQESS